MNPSKAKIFTIIPLSRSLPQDHLSYFSTKQIALGDIVAIPIRKRTYKGIVVHIEDAHRQKANLKDSKYGLRAIEEVLGPSPFSQEFFQTGNAMQEYFLGSLSQIMTDLLPAHFVANIQNLKKETNNSIPTNKKSNIQQEYSVLQNSFEERIAFYKGYIRESFARGESVRICVPTIEKANLLGEELARGIKDFCFVFHSKKSKQKLLNQFNQCVESEHPLCIIHTPRFLCVPRSDTQTTIIEFESSPHYRSIKKPFIDGRIFAEYFAKLSGHKLIYADSLLRTETLTRNKHGELDTINTLLFRIHSEAHHKVIDMRASDTSETLISNTVFQELLNKYRENKKIILFSLRPSLATTTVCGDCGTTLTHEGIPLTLHKNPETGERYFKSKKHKETFNADTTCANCGSWNLVPLGVGTERIQEFLEETGQKFSIVRVDQNHNNTPTQAKKTIESFFESDTGQILITSPIGIPYLTKQADLTCIVSLDTLFSIPQFNMYEQIMHIVMDLSLATKEKLYIQTRHAEQNIVSVLQNKRLKDFFEYDYEERKSWGYPPFSTIIKMMYEGPRNETRAVQAYLEKQFGSYEIHIYHSKGSQNSTIVTHCILQLPNTAWPLPDPKHKQKEETKLLYTKLQIFPSSWTIMVNPHNLI